MTKFTKELIEQWRRGVNADLKVDAIYIHDAEKIVDALDEIERLQQENEKLKTEATTNDFILLALHDTLKEKQQRIAKLEQERRWIPVSERLPEMHETVLVVSGGVTIAKRKIDVIRKYCWVTDDNFELKYVTHWQPLPQPPEEQQAEIMRLKAMIFDLEHK